MMRRVLVLATFVVGCTVAASTHLGARSGERRPAPQSPAAAQAPAPAQVSPQRALVNRYCVTCHNQRLKSGNLTLDSISTEAVGEHADDWERVVRRLRAGMMPPAGRPRPDDATLDGFIGWLQDELDAHAARNPNPGRAEAFHRLNRTEYQNAIRDLLALEIDATDFLPADDSSYGFDNIAGVLRMSQALMERYLMAAKTIARMAVGAPPPAVDGKTYRVAPDYQQHGRVDGLPFGTRGGLLVTHHFPQAAEYDLAVEVAGSASVTEPHQLEVTLDGAPVQTFTIEPRADKSGYRRQVDGRLQVRVKVNGGAHEVGVAFQRKPATLVEQVREPFPNPAISGNAGGPGGAMPAVSSLTITGPHDAEGPGESDSRRRIFVCRPASAADEASCARTILSTLARRAYRGIVLDDSLQELMAFFETGRAEGGSFDAGIEMALRRLLVSPEFLFRVEGAALVDAGSASRAGTPMARTSAQGPSSGVRRLSDLELASRLSFFLWSSIPDDELLDAAVRGQLSQPAVLERQVRRMLEDPRSVALTTNFAAQWLLFRNMASVRPGDPYSLAFDESLRDAFVRETELFVDSIIRDDRSAVEFLSAKHTFLNERLATHYEIGGVIGPHFRRVELPEDSPRRGILGHGSILTVTSHAIRTSPIIRGKWVLNNILGTPPPDPPANVPALVDRKTQAKTATLRERIAQHRANPACSTCHNMIDPAGFALENFDAIGRWRTVDESFNPIDASGALPDGSKFDGVSELRQELVRRPERFVTTLAEKLLTYALGRGVEHYDMPAVRKIVRDAAASDYRMHTVVLGVVRSYPFMHRRIDGPARVARREP